LRPEQRKALVGHVRRAYDISQRRACWSLRVSRTSIRYESVRLPQDGLSMRIREITEGRTTWESRRVHVLLLREGWHVNHKRVRRLYRLEGLNLRTKSPRRRKSIAPRPLRAKASHRDERWSMLDHGLHERSTSRRPSHSCVDGGRSTAKRRGRAKIPSPSTPFIFARLSVRFRSCHPANGGSNQ